MTDFNRNRERSEKPAARSAGESGTILALLIGCIAVLFLIGIRLAYDHADTESAEANPPAMIGSPATQTAKPANASSPAETTGLAPSAQTTGSGGGDHNSGATQHDQDINQNGDAVPAQGK